MVTVVDMTAPLSFSGESTPGAVAVRTLDELLAYLPFHVGFVPSRAVVVIGLRGSRLVGSGHVGFDHDRGVVGASMTGESQETRGSSPSRAGECLIDVLVGLHVDGVVVVVFEDEPNEGADLTQAVLSAVARERVTMRELVVVRGGRRWLPRSPHVDERLEGVLIAPQRIGPAIAAAVASGASPLPDRAHVRRLVAEDTAASLPVARALEELLDRDGRDRGRAVSGDRAASVWGAWLTNDYGPPGGQGRVVAGRPPVHPMDAARLMRSLTDVQWRDAVIAWSAPGSLPWSAVPGDVRAEFRRHFPAAPDDSREVLERLLALARAVPGHRPQLVAGVCSVVGCVAWQLGSGAIARDAFERALAADPGYRLAQLGLRVVRLGVRANDPDPGQAVGGTGQAAV